MTLIQGQTGSNTVNGTLGNDTLTYATLGDDIGSITLRPEGDTNDPTRALVEKELTGTDTLSSIEEIIAPLGRSNRIDASYPGTDSINVRLWGGFLTVESAAGRMDFMVRNFSQVIGSDGNDFIAGNSLSNTLEGGNGNDTISSNLGSNNLDGGAGDDRIILGQGNNFAIAGSGTNDIIGNASGNDTLDGQTGGGIDTANYITLNSGITMTATGIVEKSGGLDSLLGIEGIIGTNFNDTLIGDTGDNTLRGGEGNDFLRGIAGNNLLRGGEGNDTLQTGMFGQEGFDTLWGDGGVNQYSVAVVSKVRIIDNGNGTLATGDTTVDLPNSPNIEGIRNIELRNTKDNFARGNDLNNHIRSTAFRDGVAGNDTLDGGGGSANTLEGGRGNDRYIVRSAGDVVIERVDQGNDTIEALVSYTLPANVENLVLGGMFSNINGTGNNMNNLIIGNEGNNSLSGAGGNDTLEGGQGNDTLRGGAGNDFLRGIAGNNRLEGGDGNDTLQTGLFGQEGFDTLIGGNGVDQYSVAVVSKVTIRDNGNGTLATGDTTVDLTISPNIEGIKNIELRNTKNSFARGNDLDNHIRSTAFQNGVAGNDTLDGGGGSANTLEGGRGNDRYIVRSAGDVVIERVDQGNDTIETFVSYTLPANVENLVLAGGFGNINGTGNNMNNHIIGDEGNNSLSGVRGHNTLEGGQGNDTLTGGLALDTLVGGQGADVLVSGERRTTFVYNDLTDSLLNNHDTVQRFVAVRDSFRTSNTIRFRGDAGNAADLTESSIQTVLGTFAANTAAIFGVQNTTQKFLAINDGVAGFSATSDAVIDITGFAGTLTNNNFVV